MDIFNKLKEAGLLSDDDLTSLKESFDAKVQAGVETALKEARREITNQVREDLAQRLEEDKAQMVEAADVSITKELQALQESHKAELSQLGAANKKLKETYEAQISTLKETTKKQLKTIESFVVKKLGEELKEFNQDRQEVKEARVKYAQLISENRESLKEALVSRSGQLDQFVLTKLKEHLTSMEESRLKMVSEGEAKVAELEAEKSKLKEQHNLSMAQIQQFVTRKLAEELAEFDQDKRALVEQRVKVAEEAKTKLAETQKEFVKKAAALVNEQVTTIMAAELKSLHEDVERNRQNTFGRRIFEAIQAEFKNQHFNESAEIKQLSSLVESLTSQLNNTKEALVESKAELDKASRKAVLAEDQSKRNSTMTELLAPLSRDRRLVMEELLSSVKTASLREAFAKYLPAVLSKDGKAQARQSLNESRKQDTVAVTGDQKTNRLRESAMAEQTPSVDKDTAEILKLAGL